MGFGQLLISKLGRFLKYPYKHWRVATKKFLVLVSKKQQNMKTAIFRLRFVAPCHSRNRGVLAPIWSLILSPIRSLTLSDRLSSSSLIVSLFRLWSLPYRLPIVSPMASLTLSHLHARQSVALQIGVLSRSIGLWVPLLSETMEEV